MNIVSLICRKFKNGLHVVIFFLISDGEGVCLGVEDPFIEGNDIIIGEDQVEVFEEFGEQEWLLHVVVSNRDGIYVLNARVACFYLHI